VGKNLGFNHQSNHTGKQTDKNTEEIKELQREVRELHSWLERLAYEIKRTQDEDRHEREKLALRLENELLKFERRLPSGKEEK
jgi:archaellum component FlaC